MPAASSLLIPALRLARPVSARPGAAAPASCPEPRRALGRDPARPLRPLLALLLVMWTAVLPPALAAAGINTGAGTGAVSGTGAATDAAGQPADTAPTPPQTVRIGVLSHRGDAITRQTWGPTADYLTRTLPDWRFTIVPLDFAEVEPAVAAAAVDFVLVNPGIYVEMEVRHRIARIATMRNGTGTAASNLFGGVIFTRADRADIGTLADLRGRHLMAVDPTSLGGFEAAWGELMRQGIDPYGDLGALSFAGTHDAVVLAVRDGRADAGTVRTDILERMAADGDIRLDDFRVLNPRRDPDFPLLHSTALYPEWPFSTLHDTPWELAQQVAVALMQMPAEDAAARAGGYSGWTVALDYQPVHALLRELRRPPYDRPERFTLSDAVARYWLAVVAGAAALLVMIALTSRVLQLNARLARAKWQLERRHELILNSVAEGIYGVDLAGRTTFVNRAMERMTGWRSDELIGCSQHEVLHHTHANGDPHSRDDCPVYATFRDERPRFIEDDVFWRRDGSSFPVEYSATPIRDERGRTVGSVVVFRDNTERRQAAERIRHLELEHGHVARLSTLGEMASGIAHELNQPLAAISTNARACVRIIEAGRSPAVTCANVMARIAEQAERAGEVIRQIRRFVRKEEPQTRPIAVSALLETVLVLLGRDARRKGVTLTACIGHGVDQVLAQQTQIEQVLLNLARNGIEALAESGGGGDSALTGERGGERGERRLLAIGARAEGALVRLCVRDNGPGIAPAVRERLFQPFVTTKGQGIGLGLSISAGIVEAHGGRLAADPASDGGACFSFSLPAAETETLPMPTRRQRA